MTPSEITDILISAFTTFGGQALLVLTALIAIGIAFYVFKIGYRIFKGETVTNWAWLDQKLYKPYKGYNRFRSRQWNMEHTMN